MVERHALAEALGALTKRDAEHWRDMLGNRNCRVTIDDHAVMVGAFFDHRQHDFEHRWTVADPAEALEALHTRRLWPWAPGAARSPRWWCEACGGKGSLRCPVERRAVSCDACGDWDEEACDLVVLGHVEAPPSLPALVAVASLGVDTLARAEAIVAETWPGCALVWRALGHAEYGEARIGLTIAGDNRECSRAAHVALWDINAYPLALDSARVVLGVEGLHV